MFFGAFWQTRHMAAAFALAWGFGPAFLLQVHAQAVTEPHGAVTIASASARPVTYPTQMRTRLCGS